MTTHSLVSRALRRIRASFSVLTGRSYHHQKAIFEHHTVCFSQEGEDLLLSRLFPGSKDGYYVDVGAHHPQRYSNTYRFYLQGWRGINIEPRPDSIQAFDSLRPRDLNLQIGISEVHETLTYYAFKEPALNTFDFLAAKDLGSLLISETEIEVFPLREVLHKHLPPNQHIDFLSVDVEGYDLKVLRSNDWSRFRPSYVLVEALGMCNVSEVMETQLHEFMISQGFCLFGKLVNTVVFADVSSELA